MTFCRDHVGIDFPGRHGSNYVEKENQLEQDVFQKGQNEPSLLRMGFWTFFKWMLEINASCIFFSWVTV